MECSDGGGGYVFGLVYYKTTGFLHYKRSIKYLPSSDDDDDADADDDDDTDDLSGDDCC